MNKSYIKHLLKKERLALAKQGEYLDIFVKDRDWEVRREVVIHCRP